MNEDEVNTCETIKDFRNAEVDSEQQHLEKWNSRALNFWNDQPTTIDGVLCGYSQLSPADLTASTRFLNKIAKLLNESYGNCVWDYALDCGAGIGRVTKNCLLKKFAHVDVLEPIAKFIDEAKNYLKNLPVHRFIQTTLQGHDFLQEQYDCIWMQWCTMYIPDDELVQVLQRCKKSLKPQGVVCIKENVNSEGSSAYDPTDGSITRTESHFLNIFQKAFYHVILKMDQARMPSSCYPVIMYCIKPELQAL